MMRIVPASRTDGKLHHDIEVQLALSQLLGYDGLDAALA